MTVIELHPKGREALSLRPGFGQRAAPLSEISFRPVPIVGLDVVELPAEVGLEEFEAAVQKQAMRFAG